ncbi:MAG: DNA-directed RNA polymerase subunit L [Candidatus Hecatellales archaeon]|nr:MAG: DNA-directed RNA polymerase subunit L [Candidatus Hecatellales archaeon]
MKVILVKKTENELRFEVQDETHTLLNLLQKTLLKNSAVELAGYTIPHRLVGSAVFYVKTNGEEKPVQSILKASKEIMAEAEEFRKVFENAVKEYEKSHPT